MRIPIFPLLILTCMSFVRLNAQEPVLTNLLLDSNLVSIKFHVRGAPTTFPIADLNAGDGTLVLLFDHLGPDLKDYSYTIVHCDHDWTRSQMFEQEYIQGFTNDRILNFENSLSTLVPYTQYKVQLPNRNMRWLLSGNYVLNIYDNDDGGRLVLSRRFNVVENLWSVNAQLSPTAQVSKLRTHHEIDFTVKYKDIRIANPQNDVVAYVLQNQRWDNAIGPIRPNIQRNQQLVFDYQDVVVFPAGKEWRFFNMRTFDFNGENIRTINRIYDHFEVTLITDESRVKRPYIFRGDINGHFVIENQTPNQELLQSDYARVLFSVEHSIPFFDEDVYVFGELSNWEIHPRFRMLHSIDAGVYYLEVPLKQGYYNYQYVVVNRETGEIEEDGLEGNWYETGNEYQMLVYYRPFGARYDRLLAYGALDSRLRD